MAEKPVVAIVGRPNVGKSTLFNRLVGQRRAIVEDIPGTTRDRLYGDVEWAGRAFTVIDTGGLELSPSSDMMTSVANQVGVAVDEADLILFAVDSVDGITAADEEIAQLLRAGNVAGSRARQQKPVIVVAGKADNQERRDAANEFFALGFEDVVPVSAVHGANSGDLLDLVLSKLPEPPLYESEEDDRLKVAIVGRPNVGKSSLLNKLIGQQRVVVSDVPGTTRDAIDTEIEYAGRRFLLVDTAGIRRRGRIEQGIEKYSVLRSERSVSRADVIVLVVDATEMVTAQDLHIAGDVEREGKGIVLVVNKWDLVEKDTHTIQQYLEEIGREFNFMRWVPTVFISALTGQRVQRVLDEAIGVEAERQRRVPTGQLNEVVERAVTAHPPATHKGRQLRVYYATQATVAPPTFIFFVNDPDLVHFAYERFLENTLREAFGFRGTAVRLRFRPRKLVEEPTRGRRS
ncbi:MAG TPA: ribosome biogenesis GTPase Der [Chloroflexota bacterium]|nr:ribosome biogenesis GTPase Der [Chloroflexota bacterium]